MIFYKYLVNCAGLELEKEMQNKEDREKLYSRNSPIEEWNRDFCASYEMDKKSYLVISDLLREKMTIVAAHQADASSRTCDSPSFENSAGCSDFKAGRDYRGEI